MYLVTWPLHETEAGVDHVMISDLPAFLVYDFVLTLIAWNLHEESSEVSFKTRSNPASLSFIGQVTKQNGQ